MYCVVCGGMGFESGAPCKICGAVIGPLGEISPGKYGATPQYCSVCGSRVLESRATCQVCGAVMPRGVVVEREEPERLIALVEHEGRVRLVALDPDGTYELLDESNRRHNLYIIDARFLALADAVAELEYLINKLGVRESEIQDFFERYPDFILNDEYKAAHPHLVLGNDEHGDLIPDFVLEPIGGNPLCDLLELKLPSARTYVLKKSRHRFSSAVMEAAAQLREYSAYFDDKDKRKRFSEQYGLTAFRPRMMVIIGRRGNVDPMVARRIQEDSPSLQLKSYDDVVDHMRTKVKRITGRDI